MMRMRAIIYHAARAQVISSMAGDFVEDRIHEMTDIQQIKQA